MLRNQHMFIAGSIGSGKTFLLTLLAKRLHDAGEPVIILDYGASSRYCDEELQNVLSASYIAENVVRCDNLDQAIGKSESICILRLRVKDTDAVLEKLFEYCSTHIAYHVYLIMDEVRKITVTKNSPLGTVLYEGREAGMHLICATQDIMGKGMQERMSALLQAAVKVFLALDTASQERAAGMISSENRNVLKGEIQKLSRGAAIVCGDLESKEHEITTNQFVKIFIRCDK